MECRMCKKDKTLYKDQCCLVCFYQGKPFYLEEGDLCPECKVGTFQLPPVEGCTCFQGNPPCGACMDNKLVCTKCGEEL